MVVLMLRDEVLKDVKGKKDLWQTGMRHRSLVRRC